MTAIQTIRTLTLAETERLVDWARIEGWNPGLDDAAPFFAADPDGFIGCFVEGKLAAGISAVRYGQDFGFIGLYIADPDFRGRGYGRKVWDAGMAHLQGRTIGLDGVPEQQANYRSMGFEPLYETVRWSGSMTGAVDADVIPVTRDLLPAILNFDRNVFPSDRTMFLTEWLKPPRIAKAIVREGDLKAYAVCRRCHDGYKIGPLFAGSATDAETLLKAFAVKTGTASLHIDVPALQTAFGTRLAGSGFSKGFITARMYHGPAPTLSLQSIFGITTLELG